MSRLSFPSDKKTKDSVFEALENKRANDLDWKHGRAFSYVYYADPILLGNLKEAYTKYFSENALNPSAFPSLRSMENEVVEMCLDLFHANEKGAGLMTSGGTESILMAVKAAKNYHKNRTDKPEIILPATVHPAFNKACDYFDIKPIIIPVLEDYRADVDAMERAITEHTIMLVGSAPSYPQGVVDPIVSIAAVAKKHQLLCHVDACVGGFVLPFIKEKKYGQWDLGVDGVTSLSADIHKYGYASKGSSVILYNDSELRKAQFYVYTGWSGGIYASPSIMGTRPGGAIAVAWTVLQLLGRKGYEALVEKTMTSTKKYQSYLSSKKGLKVIGDPDMCIFSIGSDEFDIYELGDEMHVLGWNMDRQQNPAAIHLSISPIHAEVFEEFKTAFDQAYKKATKITVDSVKNQFTVIAAKGMKKILPSKTYQKITKNSVEKSDVDNKRSAALYGMIGDLQGTGELDEMIITFLDTLMKREQS